MICFMENKLTSLRRCQRPGFTLVELLVVIAVIALLVALLLPAIGAVQRGLRKNVTRARYADYRLAFENYRAEYGYYPSLGASGNVVQLFQNNDIFLETLTGRKIDGQPLSAGSAAAKANPRRYAYLILSPDALASPESPHAGQLVDGFDNPHIVVIIDRDRNGVIEGADLAEIPARDRPASLSSGVVFYSSNAEDNPDWEWVYSWQ